MLLSELPPSTKQSAAAADDQQQRARSATKQRNISINPPSTCRGRDVGSGWQARTTGTQPMTLRRHGVSESSLISMSSSNHTSALMISSRELDPPPSKTLL